MSNPNNLDININNSPEKNERMNIDGFIERLLTFNKISEIEVKEICEKVNIISL